MLPLNAMLKHELLPLIRHILTAFVVPEQFESLPSLLFCPRLILLEGIKGFTLLLEEPAASEPGGIVSEGDPVLVPIYSHWKWTM